MDMTGEHRINLPQALVWKALNDEKILKASIPGCEELVRESDTSFKGRVAAAVGPVRAKFSGEAVLSQIDAPNGYVITGSGSGGPAGMAKGSATVKLVPDGDITILRYEAKAQVAGKLAQIGARLVDMAAKKMADEFFANFAGQLDSLVDAEEPALEAALAPADAPLPDFAPAPIPAPVPDAFEISSQPRGGWLIWAGIALLVILAAAYFATR